MEGLEPTRLKALVPKTSAATNYATSAYQLKIKKQCLISNFAGFTNISIFLIKKHHFVKKIYTFET